MYPGVPALSGPEAARSSARHSTHSLRSKETDRGSTATPYGLRFVEQKLRHHLEDIDLSEASLIFIFSDLLQKKLLIFSVLDGHHQTTGEEKKEKKTASLRNRMLGTSTRRQKRVQGIS